MELANCTGVYCWLSYQDQLDALKVAEQRRVLDGSLKGLLIEDGIISSSLLDIYLLVCVYTDSVPHWPNKCRVAQSQFLLFVDRCTAISLILLQIQDCHGVNSRLYTVNRLQLAWITWFALHAIQSQHI